jgi:hypothetical protein
VSAAQISVLRQRLDELLADGEWHNRRQTAAAAAAFVPPGQAARHAQKLRARRRPGAAVPQRRGDDVSVGAWDLAQRTIASAIRKGAYELDRATATVRVRRPDQSRDLKPGGDGAVAVAETATVTRPVRGPVICGANQPGGRGPTGADLVALGLVLPDGSVAVVTAGAAEGTSVVSRFVGDVEVWSRVCSQRPGCGELAEDVVVAALIAAPGLFDRVRAASGHREVMA